jgi:acyl-CoA thioester hydrolase
MDPVFRHRFVVPESAIDRNGHVNNVVFVQWMQDIAVQHFQSAGGFAAIKAVNGGWVVRTHSVEYLAASFAGEEIEARTWIADFRKVRSLRRYEFHRIRDSKLLVRGETDWVFVDVTTGRPTAIPDNVKTLFALGSSSSYPNGIP